jgi:hypothetical protein
VKERKMDEGKVSHSFKATLEYDNYKQQNKELDFGDHFRNDILSIQLLAQFGSGSPPFAMIERVVI